MIVGPIDLRIGCGTTIAPSITDQSPVFINPTIGSVFGASIPKMPTVIGGDRPPGSEGHHAKGALPEEEVTEIILSIFEDRWVGNPR